MMMMMMKIINATISTAARSDMRRGRPSHANEALEGILNGRKIHRRSERQSGILKKFA
jgi:hypothetical protein